MWDLSRPGLEPVCPALAGGFSTTAPPGKPGPEVLKRREIRGTKTQSAGRAFWPTSEESSRLRSLCLLTSPASRPSTPARMPWGPPRGSCLPTQLCPQGSPRGGLPHEALTAFIHSFIRAFDLALIPPSTGCISNKKVLPAAQNGPSPATMPIFLRLSGLCSEAS